MREEGCLRRGHWHGQQEGPGRSNTGELLRAPWSACSSAARRAWLRRPTTALRSGRRWCGCRCRLPSWLCRPEACASSAAARATPPASSAADWLFIGAG